jgi:hypothetical protein
MFEVQVGAVVLTGMFGFILIGTIGWCLLPINPRWIGGVLAGVIGFILFSTGFVTKWYSEASVERYDGLTLAATEDCRIRPIFASAMKDGILSYGEYAVIMTKMDGMALEDARKRASGTTTAQCPVQSVQGAK